MSELENLANRVNKGVAEEEEEETLLDEIDFEDDMADDLDDEEGSGSAVEILLKGGLGLPEIKSWGLDDGTALNVDDFDINSLNLDDSFNMEIEDLGIDDLDTLTEGLDLPTTTGIIGLDKVSIEKSEEDVAEVINYINREITMYNLVIDSLNTYEKVKYTSVTDHNAKVELEHVQRGGGGVNTRENCNRLKTLIRDLRAPKLTITPQGIESRLNMVPNELKRNLWAVFESISEGSDSGQALYTQKLTAEQKESVAIEVAKILGIIEPIVETVEKSLHTNDTAKKNTLNELSGLNPKMKVIKDIEAFYEITNVTEITDGGTTISETRNYLEITAKLTRIMDEHLTRKESKYYKDEIIVRVPVHAEGASMELLTVAHPRVREMYQEKCKEEGLVPETYILKPLAYKYRKALITFGTIGDFASFRESVKTQLDSLRARRSSVNDLILSIVAGKENFAGMYLEKYKTPIKEFTRYSEREIGKMLQGKEVAKGLVEYTQMAHNLPIETKRKLHSYDTPCRRYFLGVIEGLPNAKDIVDVYYKNKIEILQSYLSVAIPYIVNLAKRVVDKNENTDEGLDMTHNIAADLITYGEPVTGFVNEYMLNKETGEYISLGSLLRDTETLDKILLADILGPDKEPYGSGTHNKKVTHTKSRPSDFVVSILDSAKILSEINVDTNIELRRKGTNKVENKVLMLEGIGNEAGHLKYLKTIIKSIVDNRGIEVDVDLDMIVKEYRERIKPMKSYVPYSNAYYMQQRGGVKIDLNSEEKLEDDNFRSFVNEINMKRLLVEIGFPEFTEEIKSLEFSEIINNDLFMNREELSKEFRIDLAQTMMTTSLIENSHIVLRAYLEAMSEETLNNYQEGTLQEIIGLPGPTMIEAPEISQYDLGEIDKKINYSVAELLKGLEDGKYPTTLVRDMIVMSKIVGTEEQFAKLGGTRSERMIGKTLTNVFNNLLAYSELPKINVGRWDTSTLGLYVEEILNQLCVSNVEYALIQDSIALKLFYQNRNVAKKNIEKQLEKYFIEDSELLEETIDLQNLLYWVEAVQVLPMDLHTEVRSDTMKSLEELKKSLKLKPVNMESQKELDMKRKRSNAYYKLFLDSGDVKYLRDVDRNYVDFELLTSQPTADGKSSGEFSKTELIQLYDLTEDLDGAIHEYEYVDIILLAEKKNPKIIETLPTSIVDFVEKDTTVSVLDPEVIETLRKDSSFNLNYKSF